MASGPLLSVPGHQAVLLGHGIFPSLGDQMGWACRLLLSVPALARWLRISPPGVLLENLEAER